MIPPWRKDTRKIVRIEVATSFEHGCPIIGNMFYEYCHFKTCCHGRGEGEGNAGTEALQCV